MLVCVFEYCRESQCLYLDLNHLEDVVRRNVGHGFDGDGDVSQDQRPDGKLDRQSTLALNQHLLYTGCGQVLNVRENKLKGITLSNNHHDLAKREGERE